MKARDVKSVRLGRRVLYVARPHWWEWLLLAGNVFIAVKGSLIAAFVSGLLVAVFVSDYRFRRFCAGWMNDVDRRQP